MSRLYGLFADLKNRPVLVVGGGTVANRKVMALLEADADITVGAPVITAELKQLQAEGRITHIAGRFDESWLEDCWLVVAATNDRALNRRVVDAANARRRFANVVDDAELSTFQVPAIVDRGPLQIAISTAGAAPVIGRRIRADLETRIDQATGSLVGLLSDFRGRIKDRFPDFNARRQFYEKLADGSILSLLRRRGATAAADALQSKLDQPTQPTKGRVILVGAGPGAAGLLTLDGLRALQQADVILHDRLASDDVLALARRDAHRINVGKAPGKHRHTQEQINALLVSEANKGQLVVRLKGGDPFIFGRGGEELQYLRRHSVDYEVVPGITAAGAAAAYTGVPLTHRDHAQSVRFVTAHCKQSLDNLDWQVFAQPQQTLAVYMGVAKAGYLQRQLLAHGRDAATPILFVENASRPEQRVVAGTLGTLTQVAAEHQVRAPALLLIGEVTALARELAWQGADVLPVVDETAGAVDGKLLQAAVS